MQSLPLEAKIIKSQLRIREWYEHWDGLVYVSFSGGKDSTVLLRLVRELYPNVPAVFVDTGLEYPEIREFVKTIEGVTWLKPDIPFPQVIEKYGYPVIGKEVANTVQNARFNIKRGTDSIRLRQIRGLEKTKNGKKSTFNKEKYEFLLDAPFKISDQCCGVMKKRPIHLYEKRTGKKPIVGTMASESSLRKIRWLKYGCNSFDQKTPQSVPISFWLESDIWQYLERYNIPYSKIYDMGVKRTGCMFCMFGVHLEEQPNRFQRMYYTHPKQYDYCINKLGLGEVLDYINVDHKPKGEQLSFSFKGGD